MLEFLEMKQSKRDKELEIAQLLATYKAVFNTPAGKAVLDDLASEGSFDRTTHSKDPLMTAFFEGKRALVLGIFEKLQINITDYLLQNVDTEEF